MSFEPLTEEQYNKAIESGYKPEEIVEFEKQRQIDESKQDNKSKDSISTQGLGYVKEHPVKTLVQGLPETITGKSMEERAVENVNSKDFMQSKEAPYDKFIPQAGQAAENQIVGGQIIDQATAPINYIGGAAMKALKGILPKVLKFEKITEQAAKSKTALDTIRTNLGQAKELALKNTGDIPAEIDWSGNMSQKIINGIKNPVYGVEFTPEGGVVNNIRNLDKIKTAMNDLVTTKDFVEAGNMEKKQIMQFAGKIRNTMVKAADDAGKPELGKSLRDYHDFMERYNPINDHLTDKYDVAQSDKLKEVFRLFKHAETKQAWKDLAKNSPELKSVVDSRTNREIMKLLLKSSSVPVGAEVGKKIITGSF